MPCRVGIAGCYDGMPWECYGGVSFLGAMVKFMSGHGGVLVPSLVRVNSSALSGDVRLFRVGDWQACLTLGTFISPFRGSSFSDCQFFLCINCRLLFVRRPQPILNAVPFSESQEFCRVRDTLKKILRMRTSNISNAPWP